MAKHKGLFKPKYRSSDGKVKESAIWWMRFRCKGCSIHPLGGQHRQSTGKEKLGDAQRELDSSRGIIADRKRYIPHLEEITVSQILQSVIADYRNKGLRSLDNTKRRIEKHLTPFFGHRSAISITGSDIRVFIAKRLSAHASNAEVNRELAALRRAYVLAVKEGVLPSRPDFELLPERNQRKGFFTYAEVQTLCEYLSQDLRDVVIFLWETGWRIMEALTREWKDIDFDAEAIHLEADETKNGQSRSFPFTQTLREMLKRRRSMTQHLQRSQGKIIPWVFNVDGEPLYNKHWPAHSFRIAWKLACEKAKLVDKVPHDLRRSSAMNLIRAGVDEQTAMDLLGHKTPSIFRRYRIVTDAERINAIRKLDAAKVALHGKQKEKVSKV